MPRLYDGSDSLTDGGEPLYDGSLLINGDLAVNESGTDLNAFLGTVLVEGDLAVSETGEDIAVFLSSSSLIPFKTFTREIQVGLFNIDSDHDFSRKTQTVAF